MCPLRIILLFLSATLAGYFAWKNIQSASFNGDEDCASNNGLLKKKQEVSVRKVVGNGFDVLVDMLSGRYLWRNFRLANTD
ncbi:hypothetical protein GIB67_021496 [Kingdonia uniflora]|uniref:Methyltransferase-related protein n=1 Tax=Kingdonia uniflora TaxID=39325 RepID=A0A7J7L9G8_9MAGN|nr:hypothetical protein GIB67_021496 [Kingdonia uniflora]